LGVVITLASFSFISSALLLRFGGDFILFKLFYLASAFWLGLVINIFLFSILAWLVILLLRLQRIRIKSIIGPLAIFAALIYSIYGVWNAFDPQIKEIKVDIHNLSHQWKGKKVIHLADLHLGRINGLSFAQKVVDQVNSQNPDMVVITGDLFDGMGSDPKMFINILNELKSTHGTYFVTGNHEAYLGIGGVLDILADSNMKILDNSMVVVDGLQIVGISYPEFGSINGRISILEDLEDYDSETSSILLYHTPTNIELGSKNGDEQHNDTYWSPDVNFNKAKEMGVDLQLSGHTHGGQIYPFNLITKAIYDGYDYGLNTEGNFNIYTSSGVGTWGPPMRTVNKSEIVLIVLE